MDEKERKKIREKALKRFGINHQIDKMIEELGELLQATIKLRQATEDGQIKLSDKNSVLFTNFLEELADFDVMRDQIVQAFELNSPEKNMLDEIKDMKLIRLNKFLEQKSIKEFLDD